MYKGTANGTNMKGSLKNLLHNPFRYHWDPDALPYLNRLQRLITVPMSTRKAWNEFVIETKRSGFWQKQDLIYPVIGGTAATHALEAKNNGLYDVTWQGGLTHGKLGVKGGVSGAGSTNWNASVNGVRFTRNDACMSCYQTQSITANLYVCGSIAPGFTGGAMAITYGGNQSLSYVNSLVGGINSIVGNIRGGWLINRRISSTVNDIFLNGEYGGAVMTPSQAVINNTMYLMCRNSGSAVTPAIGEYTQCTISFWSFGGSGGVNGIDINATNLAVHKLQRALGRDITL